MLVDVWCPDRVYLICYMSLGMCPWAGWIPLNLAERGINIMSTCKNMSAAAVKTPEFQDVDPIWEWSPSNHPVTSFRWLNGPVTILRIHPGPMVFLAFQMFSCWLNLYFQGCKVLQSVAQVSLYLLVKQVRYWCAWFSMFLLQLVGGLREWITPKTPM